MKRKYTHLIVTLAVLIIMIVGSLFFIYFFNNKKEEVINNKSTNNDVVEKKVAEKPANPYGFEYLNNRQIKLYEEFLKYKEVQSAQIILNEEIPLEEVNMVFDYYVMANPNFIPPSITVFETGNTASDNPKKPTGTTHRIHWVLAYNVEEELSKLEAVEKRANEIIATIPNNATDYEKVKFIYDYLVDNVEYDYTSYYQTMANESRDNPNAWNSYGALIEHKAVCDGIARAFHYLASKAEIPVTYIISNELDHAWNMVWLGGKYYSIDATQRSFLKETDFKENFIPNVPLPDLNHSYAP